MNPRTAIRTAITAIPLALLGNPAGAEGIDSPSYFDQLEATTIDFEASPDGIPLGENEPLSDIFIDLGVTFSSETTPGSGEFDGPMRVLAAVGGGGMPESGIRYAAGNVFVGFDASPMRIEFTLPVTAFALFVIDNDFTDVNDLLELLADWGACR